MKYLFIERPADHPATTHSRMSDGKTGHLVELPDSAVIHGPGQFVDPAGFEIIQPQENLESLKAAALEKQDSEFAAALAAGIEVGGISLGAEEHDRNAFVQMLVLLQEAERINQRQEKVKIRDAKGTVRELTVAQARSILVGYGAAYQALWLNRAERHAAIVAAKTAGELEALTV